MGAAGGEGGTVRVAGGRSLASVPPWLALDGWPSSSGTVTSRLFKLGISAFSFLPRLVLGLGFGLSGGLPCASGAPVPPLKMSRNEARRSRPPGVTTEWRRMLGRDLPEANPPAGELAGGTPRAFWPPPPPGKCTESFAKAPGGERATPLAGGWLADVDAPASLSCTVCLYSSIASFGRTSDVRRSLPAGFIDGSELSADPGSPFGARGATGTGNCWATFRTRAVVVARPDSDVGKRTEFVGVWSGSNCSSTDVSVMRPLMNLGMKD
mmetsp:Transcript_40354/g.120385  ORF Transcript_40354/g.120385 Transcript_40354/m.120385 type:complete len:267 (+) Transcript_40354:1117-1917(+)|eukprot:154858-Chlamydomonas_euryale.AAC.7